MENVRRKEVKENILKILQTSLGEKKDIAYAVYREIIRTESEEDQIANFIYFIENSEEIESNEEKHIEKIFSEEERYRYRQDYGKLIDGTLEALLKKRAGKKEFYSELWKFITENPLLESDKLKAFALYYIWIDVRVPYYELDDGLKMSNEEYSSIYQGMRDKIKKARFILNVQMEQRTERASRLVKMLEELGGEKEKAVFMSQILKLSDHTDRLLAQLLNDRDREFLQTEDR